MTKIIKFPITMVTKAQSFVGSLSGTTFYTNVMFNGPPPMFVSGVGIPKILVTIPVGDSDVCGHIIKKLQIFWSIVRFYVVNMMNRFRAVQISTQQFFHNQPVFHNITIDGLKWMIRGVNHQIAMVLLFPPSPVWVSFPKIVSHGIENNIIDGDSQAGKELENGKN